MTPAHSLPLRIRPDLRAPSVWPADTVARLQSLAKVVIYPLLPFYVLRWLFNPRGQNLKTYLLSRVDVWQGYLVPLLTPPESAEQAARPLPKSLQYIPFPPDAWDTVRWEVADVPPASEDMMGHLVDGPACVKPSSRPGFMLTPSDALGNGFAKAQPGERIILFFHGGGYIKGHPLWTPFPLKLAKDHGVRAFLCNYRKTLSDAAAFPAPLLDALAAWAYVTLNLGFAPAQILLLGDSAGAHLALALVQQLAALGRPQAGALAMVSPWTDFTASFPSWANESVDHLSRRMLLAAIRAAVRHYAPDAIPDPVFSPALADSDQWKCLCATRVLVSVGTDEVFADEDYALVMCMRRAGVDITLMEDVHGLHEGPVTLWSPGSLLSHKARPGAV
ncbi:hypothetical protein CspeluHIS016_0404290 [Cutaneotrichosporon spelunceum]|uniref:Alpha/beta hydrolase fold-3 domain-containing protein n=1 Tax=Cutaneotrichosporon spelunceum TaxID=1672016 RepID=A0AAD3TW70_9TREE|nr:hypothetical protein CspeluHIS016_0404290 [Cutaneotrichosporon spelunceum]